MKPRYLKKPQPIKSLLLTRPQNEQEQVIDWVLENFSCATIKIKIQEKFNLSLKSINQVERFWSIAGIAVMKWQQFRPDNVSPVAWECARRKNESVVKNPNSNPSQVKAALIFLTTGGRQITNPHTEDPDSTPGAENPETLDMVNPLDDQEKLDEIRREVFGSAPNTKNSSSPT